MYALPPLRHDSSHDTIRLADWIEVNLLTEEEASVSVTSVAGELGDNPPDDSDESEQRSDQDDGSSRDDGEPRKGYWEEAEKTAEDAFSELASRADSLADCYPLDVADDGALLDDSKGTLDVYRFLVLLRARQLYPEALGDDGEESGFLFEDIVTHALGAYLGSGHDQRVRFGLAKGSRGGELPQSLKEAVVELSRRISEDPGMVPNGAEGDYRADAVAWNSFGDGLPGQLVLIGQAKISEGTWLKSEPAPRWTEKSPSKDRLIRFVARPATAVAFPETLSLTSPDTLSGANFSSIPFDRLRLLRILRNEELPGDLLRRMQDWGQSMKARLAQ